MAPESCDDRRLRELALFAGAGGGILGSILLGFRVVCAVEIDPYCREVLLRRQEEGHLEAFPIWDDVRSFDGKAWRGRVDIISLGPPCQGWSVAGKQAGVDDERNLWPEAYRVIQEVNPGYILFENVPGIRTYLPVVIRDLRRAGYAVERPLTVAAAALGAGHIRRRVWIRADANEHGQQQQKGSKREEQGRHRDCAATALPPHASGITERVTDDEASTEPRQRARVSSECILARGGEQTLLADDIRDGIREQPGRGRRASRAEETILARTPWWDAEPGLARLVRRPPYRVDRISATGNIQVPAVARAAWELLTSGGGS